MSEEKVLTEIPSPMQTRAEFAEMVVKDLLGPAESAAEELDGRSVRDRYLVGVLVPRRQGAQPQLATERDEEFPPVLLDELEEDGTDGGRRRPKGTLRAAAEGNLSVIVRHDVLRQRRHSNDQGDRSVGPVSQGGERDLERGMTDEELVEIVELLRRRGTDFEFVEAKKGRKRAAKAVVGNAVVVRQSARRGRHRTRFGRVASVCQKRRQECKRGDRSTGKPLR